MGKGLISILLFAFLFIFLDEANAGALSIHKIAEQVVKVDRKELFTDVGLIPSALKKSAIRIAPACRPCYVQKDMGSGGLITLSIFAATHPHAIQSKITFTVAKSSHLFHIYPFHNFW